MWRWVKVPSIIALLAFALPWMTVSCSGQPVASATGFGLAFGSFTTFMPGATPPSGGGSGALLCALVAILATIGFAFGNGRLPRRLAAGLAAVSALLVWVGTTPYSRETILRKAAERGQTGLDQAAMALINVEWHFGYWLAVLSLLAVAVFAGLGSAEPDSADAAPPATADTVEPEPGPITRTCPQCGRRGSDGAEYCPADGERLV